MLLSKSVLRRLAIQDAKNTTCLACGWVHKQVSRKYAEEQTNEFADWWEGQPVEIRAHYIKFGTPLEEIPTKYDRKARMRDYEHCFRCGGDYKNFRDSKKGDCPDGVTIGPIINRNE